MAVAPAGVDHEEDKNRHQNDKDIKKQVGNVSGGKIKIHDDILSSRNDIHQLIVVAINPNGNTPAGGLSTANKNGITSVAAVTWPRLSKIFENRLNWSLVNSDRLFI